MSAHVIKSLAAPSAAPTSEQLGVHWIKTSDPVGHWIATGTSTVGDWLDLLNIGQGGGGGSGEVNTLVAQGSGLSLVGTKAGTELGVKTIKPGANVTIEDDGAGSLVISGEAGGGGGGGGGEANTATNVGAGIGLAKAKVGLTLPFKTLTAGSNIELEESGDGNEVLIRGTAVGEINTLKDLGQQWSLKGPKTGTQLGLYGIGHSNLMMFDQPENDLFLYPLPANLAMIPIKAKVYAYNNRLNPMAGYPSGKSYMVGTTAHMVPFMLPYKMKMGGFSVEVADGAAQGGEVMRLALYEADPQNGFPRFKRWEGSQTLQAGDGLVHFDASANYHTGNPGLYWMVIWCSTDLMLLSNPAVEAPGFGERNMILFPDTVTAGYEFAEDLVVNPTDASLLQKLTHVPHINFHFGQ